MMNVRLPLNRTIAIVSAILLAGVGIIAVRGRSSADDPSKAEPTVAQPAVTQAAVSVVPLDVFDSIVGAGSFTTFARLLRGTDLAVSLKGTGPFTVFVPTDDAFAALPDGTLAGWEADTSKLTRVLSYHVVPGNLPAGQMTTGELSSLEGSNLTLEVVDGVVSVNDATAIVVDLTATNGVMQIVDRVLVPPDL